MRRGEIVGCRANMEADFLRIAPDATEEQKNVDVFYFS
jgi:hypothetical protein